MQNRSSDLKRGEIVSPDMGINITEIHSGPLPSPDIMAGYAMVDSTIPGRIMADFEQSAAQIREMRLLSQKADIAKDERAQWMAFVFGLLMLALAFFSVHVGAYWVAVSEIVLCVGYLGQKLLKEKWQQENASNRIQVQRNTDIRL